MPDLPGNIINGGTDTEATKKADLTSLLNQLSDNVSGQISAHDIRDAVYTMRDDTIVNPGGENAGELLRAVAPGVYEWATVVGMGGNINSGTAGNIAYYKTTGQDIDDTSMFWDDLNSALSITTSSDNALTLESTDTFSGLYLKDQNTTTFLGPAAIADNLTFRTQNIERMRIKPGGSSIIAIGNPSNLSYNSTLYIGENSTTATTSIELGINRTNDGNSYIDFWSTSGATHSDYSTRIWRRPGENGNLDITNKGTGGLTIKQENAGAIYLATNGSNRLSVLSNGDVGIGTIVPQSKLHIFGNSDAELLDNPTGLLMVGNTAPGQNNLVMDGNEIMARFGATGTNTLRFQRGVGAIPGGDVHINDAIPANAFAFKSSTGRLGIGTLSPNARLSILNPSFGSISNSPGGTSDEKVEITSIVASQSVSYNLSVNDSGTGTIRQTRAKFFLSDGSDESPVGDRAWGLWETWNAGGQGPFVIGMASEKFRIATNGNVGIGNNTAPAAKLHILGGTDAGLTSPTSGFFVIGNVASENIVMDTNELMVRNNGAIAYLRMQQEGGNITIGAGAVFAGNPVPRLGIGVTTPTASLDLPVSDTARASLRIRHGAAPSVPNDGDIWTTSAGLFVRINGATVGPLS